MKKLLSLFVLVLLFSCSADDDGVSGPQLSTEGTLPKKGITSTGGSVIQELDYFYNGNEMASWEYDNIKVDFFYTGDLVTSSKRYNNNVLSATITYTYSNDKLVQALNLSNINNTGYKTTYTHNPDGTVLVVDSQGDLISQNNITKTYKMFFENGRVSKKEIYQTINGNPETTTHTYTYDTKNHYYKAVTGFDKLTLYDNESFFGSSNNVSSIAITATNSTATQMYSTQYTYNTSNYPITKMDTHPDGTTVVSQLYYQ